MKSTLLIQGVSRKDSQKVKVIFSNELIITSFSSLLNATFTIYVKKEKI